MLCTFFTREPPRNFAEVSAADVAAFKRYFHSMLEQGIYMAPSAFEAGFVSLAHETEDLDRTIKAHGKALEAAFRG